MVAKIKNNHSSNRTRNVLIVEEIILNKQKKQTGFTQRHFFGKKNGADGGSPSTIFPKNGAGFTIIELLVAITIFAIVLTSVVSLFGSALRNQKQIMSQSEALNSASYVSEYMARALRMATKDMAGACIGAKNNFVSPNGDSTIRFLNYDNKCQEFGLSIGAIYVKKSTTASAANLGAQIPITAGTNRMTVEKLAFNITGNDQEDIFQPKVAFTCEIKSVTKAVNRLKIQTTVSQRNLDVPR